MNSGGSLLHLSNHKPHSMNDTKDTEETGKGLVFAISIESYKRRGRIVEISDSGIIGKPINGNPGSGLWAGDNGAIIKGIIRWLTHQK